MFFKFPYTDLYTLNLDWMIKYLEETKASLEQWQTIIDSLGTIVHSVNGQTGNVNLGTLVNSVNGKTGNVNLGTLVNSVNGKTGNVEIDNDDINELKIELVLQTTDPVSTFTPAVVTPLFNSGIRFIIINNKEFYSITEAGAMIRFNPFEDLNISKELAQPPANQAEIEALYNQGIRFIRYAVSDVIKTYALEKIDSVVVAYDLDGTNGANLFNFIDSNKTIEDYSTATLRNMYNSGVRILFQDETNGIRKFYALLGTEVDGYTGYTEYDPVNYFDTQFVPSLQNDINALKSAINDTNENVREIDSDLYTYNKNVFPNNVTWENAVFGSNGEIINKTTGTDDATEVDYIPVTPGDWTVSWKAKDLNCRMYAWGYNANYEPLSLAIIDATMNIVTRSVTFTAPANCAYIRIRIYRSGATYTDIIPEELQVESGTTATAYVPWSKTSKFIAVDEQLEDHDEAIDEISNEKRLFYSEQNLLDDLIVGYVKNDGSFSPMSSWRRSDYIPVRPGMYVYFYNINPYTFFYYYTASKEKVGGKDIETPVTLHNAMLVIHQVPEDAYYMIVSLEDTKAATCWGNYTPTIPTGKLYYSNKATLRSYVENPENPCDYEGMDVCTFRSGICIGDSITAGGFNYSSGTNPWHDGNVYSYPSQFQKMTGVSMMNEGHSGLTTVQWWNTYGTGGEHEIDFSGHDFAIIHLGINDVSYNVSISDTIAAYTNIINALKNANEGIKIFVCTIIPAYADATFTSVYTNINNMVKNFANTLENVYLCDLTEYGHEYTVSQYAAGHLTAYGYWRMAKDLISYIGYIMQSIPEEFRFIHFIGTDMEYTPGQ